MNRVAVIGCGGSGKTTLSRELGARLGLDVLHVDGFYWRVMNGASVESTPAEWERTHAKMIAGDRWVIDGMKLEVLPARLAAADTLIFLDVPTRTCLWGVLRRRLRFRGQLRPEIGVYDRINWEFISWIWSFRRRHRTRILRLLEDATCEVIILRSHRQIAEFLETMHPH